MKLDRTRLSTAAYVVGALVLLASGVKLLFAPPIDTVVRVGAGLGAVLLAAGVFLDPDRVRRLLTGRQGRFGSNALVLSLAFTGILVVLNVLAYNNPAQLDLTEDKQFSLTRETELLLTELSQPVHLVGFYSPDRSSSRDQIRPILDQYVDQSNGLVSYEFIDPRANPLVADQYGITRDASMAILVGDNSQVVDFPSELEISSAIVQLTNPEEHAVYFLTGHGELDFDASADAGLGQLKSALENKNYKVEQLNLVVEGQIPADAAVLVVAGPRQAFEPGEIDLIDQYLKSGGSLIAMFEPTSSSGMQAADENLNQYLADNWGVEATDDFVIDLNSMQPQVGLSFGYGAHTITDRLQGYLTLFPTARSIVQTDSDNANLRFVGLVMTSDRSWGETDFSALTDPNGSVQFDEGSEVQGPLNLAAAVQDSTNDTRIVVVGDSDFASNAGFTAGGNGDLAVNSIDWASKQENLIDITPRSRTQRQVLPATRSTVLLLVIGTTVLIPGGILAAGGRVWWSRRKRN